MSRGAPYTGLRLAPRSIPRLAPVLVSVLLIACGSAPVTTPPPRVIERPESRASFRLSDPQQANEIILTALSLMNTGYVFGGRNPEAGLDCSGMVSYVVEQASGKRLPHNAAQIAALTQSIPRESLQPADLVFFNTNGSVYSHMGIYIGDGRFIHAPSSRGKVRIERLDNPWFTSRFTGARSLF